MWHDAIAAGGHILRGVDGPPSLASDWATNSVGTVTLVGVSPSLVWHLNDRVLDGRTDWSPSRSHSHSHSTLSFRVLGPHERGRFSPEAWGHLLSLVGTGLVNGGELEHIIERALLQIDGPIALDDLRAFMDAAGLVARSYPDPAQQTIH